MAVESGRPNILLTGFEPFGTNGMNTSGVIAQKLDGASLDLMMRGIELALRPCVRSRTAGSVAPEV